MISRLHNAFENAGVKPEYVAWVDEKAAEGDQVRQWPGLISCHDGGEIPGKIVGDYMWNGASCSSVIITEDQRKEATEKFKDTEYSSFDPGFKEGVVYVIFGDEYDGLAQEINQIMEQIAEEKKIPRVYRSDFN